MNSSNTWVTEVRGVRKYFDLNENENHYKKSCGGTAKAGHRQKFIT